MKGLITLKVLCGVYDHYGCNGLISGRPPPPLNLFLVVQAHCGGTILQRLKEARTLDLWPEMWEVNKDNLYHIKVESSLGDRPACPDAIIAPQVIISQTSFLFMPAYVMIL